MNDEPLTEDIKCYSFFIPSKLKERLDKHLQRLKYLRHPQSKRQFWLSNAFQEKLHREEESDEPCKSKYLNVILPQDLAEQLSLDLKNSHYPFSKKKWILEAIEEKLESDKILIQSNQTAKRKVLSKDTPLPSLIE